VPGLTVSGDYIDVKVLNQIIPTTLSNAAQFCYDSATFGDTSATLGVNTCDFFSRAPTSSGGAVAFNIQNGFASGFINLGALQVRGVNGSAEYQFEVGSTNPSRIRLRANVYHLLDYISSAAGDFTDSQNSAGSFFRPRWETQLSGRYERDAFFLQWTWNWQSATRFFDPNLGAFATVEQRDVIRYQSFGLHDAAIGYTVNDQFGLQLTVRNLFDKRYAGVAGLATGAGAVGNSGQIDLIGRRLQLTARARF
jgi:outer membrane receptor protein involved in Fe transport